MFRSFKSQEERWFDGWLKELTILGYVKSYSYEPVTVTLAEPKTIDWNKQLHTKVKSKTFNIKPKIQYTIDFEIIWNIDLTDGILTFNSESNYTSKCIFWLEKNCYNNYIEIKGMFDRLGTSRDTKTKMAWAQEKCNINITLIKPLELFSRTFYPEVYLLTESGNTDRKKKMNGVLTPIRDIVENITKWNAKNSNNRC